MTSRCGLPLRGEVDYSDHVRPSQDFCRSFDRGSLFEHRGTFERVRPLSRLVSAQTSA